MGQTQGHELPYDVGEQFTSLSSKSIWSVHSGKKKATGESVTVFVFDQTNKSPEEIKLAQCAHLRLKTLRHPNILKYIDGVELPTCIYVVTEEVVPLVTYMATKDGSTEFSKAWGIHQVLKAVQFLSHDCALVHDNINTFSIFVDLAGEWKLGGVEFMHAYADPDPVKGLHDLHKYNPPEVGKSTRRSEKWSRDVWGVACLVWEAYNGELTKTADLKMTGKIPKSLVSTYSEMLSGNPKSRPDPATLLASLREHGGYLASNFISIALRIEEVQIMVPMQRTEFFNELNKSLDNFPESFAKHKILPQLITAFEFGGAGSSVLAPLFKLGALLKGEEYQRKIVPCVVKLFSSTDRATRLNLLQQLEFFVDHLLPVTVNDQIFPHIAHGYSDTVPAIRELTVKATVLLAPKLSSATLNGQLLKYLAKCQLDEKPDIRVLTNICLGRIAGHLNPATRQKVLVTAFLRALKDPFPPARIAAIDAMAATHMYFSSSDLSGRILPALCVVTVDKEKSVRDKTFNIIKMFLAKLEKWSENPQAAAEQERIEASASSWTGWAMSSITAKFYRGSTQTSALPSSSGATESSVGAGNRDNTPASGGSASSTRATTMHGQQVPGVQEVERAHGDVGVRDKKADSLDDWQDDGDWEDVSGVAVIDVNSEGMKSADDRGVSDQPEKEDSDMEGWEDDGWGSFSVTSPATDHAHTPAATAKPAHSLSSGADFFDSIATTTGSSSVNKKDPFAVWSSGTGHHSDKSHATSSNLPSASSLFQPTPSSSGVPDKSGSGPVDAPTDDGWGDWNEDSVATAKKTITKKGQPSSKSKSTKDEGLDTHTSTGQDTGWDNNQDSGWGNQDSGWGNQDSGWGNHDSGNQDSGWGNQDSGWGNQDSVLESHEVKTAGKKSDTSSHQGSLSSNTEDAEISKQQLKQKRMEERRLKQQAAREKRAAGGGAKPGLGAIKRD